MHINLTSPFNLNKMLIKEKLENIPMLRSTRELIHIDMDMKKKKHLIYMMTNIKFAYNQNKN